MTTQPAQALSCSAFRYWQSHHAIATLFRNFRTVYNNTLVCCVHHRWPSASAWWRTWCAEPVKNCKRSSTWLPAICTTSSLHRASQPSNSQAHVNRTNGATLEYATIKNSPNNGAAFFFFLIFIEFFFCVKFVQSSIVSLITPSVFFFVCLLSAVLFRIKEKVDCFQIEE